MLRIKNFYIHTFTYLLTVFQCYVFLCAAVPFRFPYAGNQTLQNTYKGNKYVVNSDDIHCYYIWRAYMSRFCTKHMGRLEIIQYTEGNQLQQSRKDHLLLCNYSHNDKDVYIVILHATVEGIL